MTHDELIEYAARQLAEMVVRLLDRGVCPACLTMLLQTSSEELSSDRYDVETIKQKQALPKFQSGD